ncbi:hypothetical protein [Massilia phyllosphaerae]|uniref:hypothetical protein n=1 Tax=Massilia phyllosphaerae TaxID=3106034 RepID=UPI002B1CD063|nr:hypothetical protein [Massilia sp. SGZ-792]
MNSNEFPRMVYQAGGTEEIHGGRFATRVAHDAEELDAALADGWHLTTDEARAPKEEVAPPAPADDTAPPTRAELEAKATELSIEFSPRIGDAKLFERIEAALAPKA